MSEPQPMDDSAGPRGPPVPSWATVTIFGLLGVYGGWWGEGFFAWIPAGGLIAASAIGWSLALFSDWLRRSIQVGAFPVRGLLAVLIAFGVIGGTLVGLLLWLPAALIAGLVKGIADDTWRTAAGAGAGAIFGIVCSWAAYRQRKSEPRPSGSGDNAP